jgi:hypothetical protein
MILGHAKNHTSFCRKPGTSKLATDDPIPEYIPEPCAFGVLSIFHHSTGTKSTIAVCLIARVDISLPVAR